MEDYSIVYGCIGFGLLLVVIKLTVSALIRKWKRKKDQELMKNAYKQAIHEIEDEKLMVSTSNNNTEDCK